MTPAEALALNDDADDDNTPRRPSRLRLDTVDRVRRELVRLYRDGLHGVPQAGLLYLAIKVALARRAPNPTQQENENDQILHGS